MTVTIVDAARPVTGSVDTHLDLNVAAALDPVGGLLGVAEFSTTSAGHRGLLCWLAGALATSRLSDCHIKWEDLTGEHTETRRGSSR